MNRKIVGSLVGILFSLGVSTQTGAEIPPNYTSWPVKFSEFDGIKMTYRRNELPDSEAVREYWINDISNPNEDSISIKVIGYSRKSNPNPKLNSLEIKVEIRDKNYKNDKIFLENLYRGAKSWCGECHPTPVFRYVGNFNIPKFVNITL